MLFEILTEDVSDGFIENDIIKTLKTTSGIVQNALGMEFDDKGNLSKPTVGDIRSTNGACFHWTEAERVSNAGDKEKLIYAYTSTFALGSRLDTTVVTTLRTMDIWMHIISDLGFRNASNPFITYVLKYKNFNTELMRAQLIVLNNLYVNETIGDKELTDSTSILYNPALWVLGMNDCTKLVENYIYVRDHRSSYDGSIPATKAADIRIKERVDAHPESMENYMVFQSNPIPPSGGKDLEPAYVIEEFVNKFFKNSTETKKTKKSKEEEPKELSKLTRSKKDSIDKLFKEGGFKFSDLADITAYIKELYDSGYIR